MCTVNNLTSTSAVSRVISVPVTGATVPTCGISAEAMSRSFGVSPFALEMPSWAENRLHHFLALGCGDAKTMP